MELTEETQTPDVVAQDASNHEKKSPQESFAELRKAKEDADREIWQLKKERELLEKQRLAQATPQQPQEEDFDYRQLEQEEFPDGKKLAKAFNSMNKKMSSYEQKLAEKENKIKMLETTAEFPDWKDVVTEANIQKYIMSDEDNRESVEKAANPLRKVYNLIKKDARYQADKAPTKPKPISQEQQRVDDKEGKPKTGSLGVRSDAVSTAAAVSNSKMSKEQRNALWAETLQASRR